MTSDLQCRPVLILYYCSIFQPPQEFNIHPGWWLGLVGMHMPRMRVHNMRIHPATWIGLGIYRVFFFPFVLFFVIFLVAFFFRSKFCLAYTMYGCRVFVPSFLIVDFGSTTLFLLTEPGGGWWNFSTKAFAFTRASSSANLSSCRSITSGKASIFSDTFACFNHLLNLKFEAALPFCLV